MKKMHSIITLDSNIVDLSRIENCFSGTLLKHREPNVPNKRGVLGSDWCFSFEYDGLNENECIQLALKDFEISKKALTNYSSKIEVTILLVVYFTDHCSLGFDKELIREMALQNIQFNVDVYKISDSDL